MKNNMFRAVIVFFAFVLLQFSAVAQDKSPVSWSQEVKKISADEFEIIFTATIEGGWHLYSQHINGEGPVPTKFDFKPGKYKLVGAVEEQGKPENVFDKGFEINVTYYSHEVKFVQRVKTSGAKEIKGTYEFMVCDDEMCLPPREVDFSVKLP